jgi:hypothetical protein
MIAYAPGTTGGLNDYRMDYHTERQDSESVMRLSWTPWNERARELLRELGEEAPFVVNARGR